MDMMESVDTMFFDSGRMDCPIKSLFTKPHSFEIYDPCRFYLTRILLSGSHALLIEARMRLIIGNKIYGEFVALPFIKSILVDSGAEWKIFSSVKPIFTAYIALETVLIINPGQYVEVQLMAPIANGHFFKISLYGNMIRPIQ